MTANATATHSPERESAVPMCSETRSFRVSASAAAVVGNRIAAVRRPTPTTARTARTRPIHISASVAATPAGTHAITIRPTGCAPRRASSSSGSAPFASGPRSIACARLSR